MMTRITIDLIINHEYLTRGLTILAPEEPLTLFSYEGPHQLLFQTVTYQAIGSAVMEYVNKIVREKSNK